MNEIKAFLKSNLGPCCAELQELNATGILPVGKVWEAMGMLEIGMVGTIREMVQELAIEAVADEFKHPVVNPCWVPGINVPNITASVVGQEVVILFKNKDSLVKFETPDTVDFEFLAKAINEELQGLDFEGKDFGTVFNTVEYRKAVLAVVNKMF